MRGHRWLCFLRTRPQPFASAQFCLVSPFKGALSPSLLAQAGPGICREPEASSLQAKAQSQHALHLRSAPSLRCSKADASLLCGEPLVRSQFQGEGSSNKN